MEIIPHREILKHLLNTSKAMILGTDKALQENRLT